MFRKFAFLALLFQISFCLEIELSNEIEALIENTIILKTSELTQKVLQQENEIKKLRNRIDTLDLESKATVDERLDKLEQQFKAFGNTITVILGIFLFLNFCLALRSCQEYKDAGFTISGLYYIDPDGLNVGDSPITVYCDFETGN